MAWASTSRPSTICAQGPTKQKKQKRRDFILKTAQKLRTQEEAASLVTHCQGQQVTSGTPE